MEDIEELKKNLESQEKRVYEKINPILQSYNKDEITKKELIEKLSDAFYKLEEEYR